MQNCPCAFPFFALKWTLPSPLVFSHVLTEWTHLLFKVLQSSMSLLFTWRLEKILHFSPLKPTLTRLVQHTAFWWVHVFSILQFSCRQLFLFYTRSPPHSLSSIIRVTCYMYKVLCCLQILKDVPRMTSLAHLFQEKRIQEVSISFTTMLIIVQIYSISALIVCLNLTPVRSSTNETTLYKS